MTEQNEEELKASIDSLNKKLAKQRDVNYDLSRQNGRLEEKIGRLEKLNGRFLGIIEGLSVKMKNR